MFVNQEITITSSFICQKSYHRAYKIKGSYCIDTQPVRVGYWPFLQLNLHNAGLKKKNYPKPGYSNHIRGILGVAGRIMRVCVGYASMGGFVRENERGWKWERKTWSRGCGSKFMGNNIICESDCTRVVFVTFGGELQFRMETSDEGEQMRERESGKRNF